MTLDCRRGPAVAAFASVFALVGCAATTTSHSGAGSPASRPGGASAQVVHYQCVSGREGTIAVNLPDPRSLPQAFNPINACEYDRGLASVRLTVRCAAGGPEKEVRLAAKHGQLPASAARTICD